MSNSYFGYPLREAAQEELLWFRANLNIAGYACDDGFIVINPFSSLSEREINAVCINEAIRLFMRAYQINPNIELTPMQTSFFKGTAYEDSAPHAKQSIIARIISGDPSAQDSTPDQRRVAQEIYELAIKNENT